MRGQASFILIIAIVFLIAIVIYYASQSPSRPPAVGEEERAVRDMVEGIITSGAERTLMSIELQGGYLTPPDDSVTFTNIGVPYWQICQNDISPTLDEVKGKIEKGIEYYVNNHTGDIEDFFGKNLSLRNVSRVDVNILENKIDVSVHMTTRFQGHSLSQPYTVSVPTRLKHLFDFAKDTVTEINRNPSQGGRFFETFTIASLYKSKYLPTIGFLTSCGQSIRLTPQEISQRLEEIITYTITHFIWWSPMPSEMTYAVEHVNGKQYADIDPLIFLPQGFEVTSSDSVNIKNNEWIAYFPFPIPYCTTAYDIKYSVEYPLIIKATDPDTGYDFNFAVYVNVNEMGPGNCNVVSSGTTPVPGACSNLGCSANMRIVDCNGNGLQGADAYFGNCFIGASDSGGYINGNVLCGTHELDIYHSGDYDYYFQSISSAGIDGTYTLCKNSNFNVQFNEIGIMDSGYDVDDTYVSCYPCADPADCPSPFTLQGTDCTQIPVIDKCVTMKMTSDLTGRAYHVTNSDYEIIPEECLDQGYVESHPVECSGCVLSTTDVDNVPAGQYDVTVELRDPASFEYVGYIEVNDFTLMENSNSLTVNVPVLGSSSYEVKPWQKSCISGKLDTCSGIEALVQT